MRNSVLSNSVLSIILMLVLSFSCVPFSFAQDISPLTNADILTMVRAKLPPALIIEKINTSSCNFDTFPTVLAELKYKGVSDEILMAMVKAPRGARPPKSEDSYISPSARNESQSGNGTQSKAAAPSNSISESSPTNIGGINIQPRGESPFNARFYIAPMEEGFDGLISALMIEKKLPLKVVADESLADFIVVGGTNKGVHKWYDTVFGSGYERDRNQGSLRVIRVRDKTVVWGAQKGDRSFWWGALKKGGKRKVAERLVNEMKNDLFRD